VDLGFGGAVEADWGHFLSGPPPLSEAARAFLSELTGAPVGLEDAWRAALTHGSYSAQFGQKGRGKATAGVPEDYQRLEFLGDRVLGLSIAQWLYQTEADAEGKLSQRLNVLVSRQMCASVARSVGLPEHILLGKQARDDGGHDSDNILGDVMEALLGAHFLLRGYEATAALIHKLWAEAVGGRAGQSKHPKSALQEWAAGNRRKAPEYRLVERSGPDHAARFTVAVAINGVGEAQAFAASKQEAETAAAAQFLRQYG
jgi:ribonuclease-3